MKQFIYCLCSFTVCFFSSCSNEIPVRNEVVVHILSDPEMMNPVNTTDLSAGFIVNHIFQRLVDVDFRNPGEFVPVLAVSRPAIEKTTDGKMLIRFQIRKEARWDNGSPVTAKDVEFTIKTIKCPLVNNQQAKPYFEFISDFVFDKDDPLKFTIISNEVYMLAEAASFDYHILPEYFYDPKGLMENFTVRQITEENEKLKSDPKMKEFADDFNSEKRMRDPEFISGSGAYKFTEWKTSERLTLSKKENWWGTALEKENCYFEAYPEKLIYQIINDQTTALVSLKAGNLDLMNGIKSKDFHALMQSEKVTQNFNLYTPMMYSYLFIGLNTKTPLLSDKMTRQAIAHLVDIKKMIETIKYGQAQQVIGPVHPSKSKAYNASISPYGYNPEKSKNMLGEAGWKNTNGDETLDKMIDGKLTEFELTFYYNAGNDERKSIALMLQEEAKKVGIKINVLPAEWAVYLEKCRKHEFDLMIQMLVSAPTPDDFKQTFHSESAISEGGNFSSFSSAEADALIDSMRTELNEDRRAILTKRFQEILHDEVPVIFLWSPMERIAIHKRFENAYPSVMRPGFWEQGFKLSPVK